MPTKKKVGRSTKRIRRSDITISVGLPRLNNGQRIATLMATIGPETQFWSFVVDEPLPEDLLDEVCTWVGGLDWPTEIAKALEAAALAFPERQSDATWAGHENYETVWTPALEASGHVPGIGSQHGPSSLAAMGTLASLGTDKGRHWLSLLTEEELTDLETLEGHADGSEEG